MLKRRPLNTEFEGYSETYISRIQDTDICKVLREQETDFGGVYASLTDEQWDFRYAPEKWTIKDVILHIIDTERIFAYRALRISRGDATALPGFDQDPYVDHAFAAERSSQSLLEEYHSVRQSSIHLFTNMRDEDCIREGKASNLLATPIATAYMIAGHEDHHMAILKERYL